MFSTMRTRSGAALAALTVLCLAGGCSQKGKFKSDIRDADFIPVKYPQSQLRAGSLGWGHPRDVPENLRPAEQNFSDQLLVKIPKSDAAWFGTDKQYETYLNAVVEPGSSAQILENLRILDGEAQAEITKGGMKFVDWDEMQEENIDFQRLSEAIVRGWYNMPGESMKLEALAALRPDKESIPNRPWLIRRSIMADGMRYEVSSTLASNIGAKTVGQVYMDGKAKAGFEVEDGTFLKINKPMVVGYDTAELTSIEPPLPTLIENISPNDMEKHVFIWKSREARNRNRIEVEPKLLRTMAKRQAADGELSESLVSQFEKALESSSPLGIAVSAAAMNKQGGNWEPIGEGDMFYDDELVRLSIHLDRPGHLYILSKDSKGQAVVLYPRVEGEPLSRGEDRTLPAGTFNFPYDVVKQDGLAFEAGSEGTESFVIVATREANSGIKQAMAVYAKELSKKNDTRGVSGLGIERVVSSYGSAQTASGDVKEMPLFSGINGATVMTLNFTRKPVQ